MQGETAGTGAGAAFEECYGNLLQWKLQKINENTIGQNAIVMDHICSSNHGEPEIGESQELAGKSQARERNCLKTCG